MTDAAEKTAAEMGPSQEAVETNGAEPMVVDGEEPPKQDNPAPAPTPTPAPRRAAGALDTRQESDKMHSILKAAIKAGEDKIGLAQTLYEAVSRLVARWRSRLRRGGGGAPSCVRCKRRRWCTGSFARSSDADLFIFPPDQVDRHIQRLDADLAANEDSLVIGLRDGTLPSHDAPSLSLKEAPGPTTSRAAIALGELPPYSGDESAQIARGKGAGLGKTGGKVGMSVDPNEPRYCFCNRVSFGEMVGCDNEDCRREWFHFECVGIKGTRRPEGEWYCAECLKKGAGSQSRPENKTKRRRMR